MQKHRAGGDLQRLAERLKELTGREIEAASNPEFLKEGAAIDDFMKPDRVVIGTRSAAAAETLAELFGPYLRTDKPLLIMSPESAEMTKYAANCLLAAKISFINEMANICERSGADVNEVRRGIGHDSRIGFAFLFPGAGFGGSCLPKDVRALSAAAKSLGIAPHLLNAVHEVNERQKHWLAERIEEHFGGKLAKKAIAVWGLSFKPGTDDIRDAPAIALVERLLKLGAKLRVHDPVALENVRKRFGDQLVYCDRRDDALIGAERAGDRDRMEAVRASGLRGDETAHAAAGDLRRAEPLRSPANARRRHHVLQRRPTGGSRRRMKECPDAGFGALRRFSRKVLTAR